MVIIIQRTLNKFSSTEYVICNVFILLMHHLILNKEEEIVNILMK